MLTANEIREARGRQIKIRHNVMGLNHSREEFFKKKTVEVNRSIRDKERSIQSMERAEAELLEKIKMTQNRQRAVFNQLEDMMYNQQFSVKKRVQQRALE